MHDIKTPIWKKFQLLVYLYKTFLRPKSALKHPLPSVESEYTPSTSRERLLYRNSKKIGTLSAHAAYKPSQFRLSAPRRLAATPVRPRVGRCGPSGVLSPRSFVDRFATRSRQRGVRLLRGDADHSAGHLGSVVSGPELRVRSEVCEPDVPDTLWIVVERVSDLKQANITAALDSRLWGSLKMSAQKLLCRMFSRAIRAKKKVL